MPAGKIYRAPARKPLNVRQTKQVQRIIQKNKQFKTFHDSFLISVSDAKDLTEFTAITEGDDYNTRDGDKIQLKNILVHLSINTTDTPIGGKVRLMMIRSKTGPLVVADLPAYNAEPDLDKYAILYEEFFNMQDDNINPINRKIKLKFQNKKVPHMNVHFDDDESATLAQRNPVYMYWVSSASCAVVLGNFYTNFFNAN